ncbi:LysR family transcriptional regulator [Krasilnikoviella flava]|uniref:Regulatory helix-turn-helix protein, lysR family n=1 Tax=Krasilnikoviella flava TaxID=526729 RepID=A0A1T5LJT6_9MICO|nr:LysR family transcriptional regulator [Krasilnikoviella flava]SKC76256.1 regulatory helix-turn-helix protein, lysR family [Krasilnikoviella flava]
MENGCRAFVAVSERGSFTGAAAALGVPQPVISRRVAGLEAHLGGSLFDRTTREVFLTPLGRRLLPVAARLVGSADDLRAAAAMRETALVRLAVPEDMSPSAAATLIADAQEVGVRLRTEPVPAGGRVEMVRDSRADAALVGAASGAARWSAPLGVGTCGPVGGERTFLDELAPRRGDDAPGRRVWVTPEDDNAGVGDVLTRHLVAAGCLPRQVEVAALVPALVAVTTSTDLLLCTRAQARELGLAWSRLGGVDLVRTHRVELRAGDPGGVGAAMGALSGAVAHALGATEVAG